MVRLSIVAATLLLLPVSAASAAGVEPPEKGFEGYPNRLSDVPAGWSTTHPIRLKVCFNLKHPVNSPEANAFLKDFYRTVSTLPNGVPPQVERMITPAKYAYCGTLTFRDWAHNRAYEGTEAFVRYYYDKWVPAVADAEEQWSVLDPEAAKP